MADLVKLLSVLTKNLDSHLKAELVEVEVDASNLAVLENLGHTLRTTRGLNGVALDKDGFFRRKTVGLKNVHILDGILGLARSIGHLDLMHGANNHVGEEVRLSREKLGAHGSLGGLKNALFSELVLAHN